MIITGSAFLKSSVSTQPLLEYNSNIFMHYSVSVLPQPGAKMKKLDENIWTHEDAMSLMGTHLPLRMTIIKLSDDTLWVHSPTQLSAQMKNEVDALGTVSCIVGASNGHNNWLKQWQQAYPQATLYVSAGIPKKLGLADYQLLDESSENIWQDNLVHEYMDGVPFFNESVFLHTSSKSLIVTDFIQNYDDKKPSGLKQILANKLFRLIGFKGTCIAPPLKMGFMIKDKAKFSACIARIQALDFDRIIVAHGDIIDSNAKQVLNDLCQRFNK